LYDSRAGEKKSVLTPIYDGGGGIDDITQKRATSVNEYKGPLSTVPQSPFLAYIYHYLCDSTMPAEIIDVHSRSSEGIVVSDIPNQIIHGLSQPPHQKHIPTMLLYDERGLRLYDDITTEAPEYYLFAAEEEILKTKADEIVQAMHRGSDVLLDEVIVELGAG